MLAARREQEAEVKRILKAMCYYEVLQIKRDAEHTEVKRAYRKMALSVHPDRNATPGATDALKKVAAV